MNRKRTALLLMALTLLLAACGANSGGSESGSGQSSGEQQVKLRATWWGGQERHDATLQVIDLFEEKYPHIKIEAEYSGLDGYFDKLSTQFAAVNAPDIIQYGGNLNDYVNQGVVLDLNPYIGNELDLSKHDQSMIDAATFDGKFYGVTLGTNAVGLLINKTLFEEANVPLPDDQWTYQEFAETAAKLSAALDGIYGTEDFQSNAFSIFLVQRGKREYDNGRIGFDAQDAQDWFQMWDDWRKQGGVVAPEIQAAASSTPEQSMLIKRQVAMQLISSNQLGTYKNATEDELVLHIYPYENGMNGIALSPSQFMAGNAKTEHPEEVAMFLDFMVNDPEATAILGNDRGAPVNSDVRQNLISTASETDSEIFSYIDLVSETSDVAYKPNMPGYNENKALYQRVMEKVAFGQSTPAEAAQEYYTELQKIIEKMG